VRRQARLGEARVWALTALLAMLAVAVVHAAEQRHVAPLEQPWATWWTLAAMFAISEVFVVHVPRVTSASSHSLREIPTAFGLLLLTPSQYMIAVIVGTGAALLFVVRQRGTKLAFNLALFGFEAALAFTIYRALGVAEPLGLPGWLAVLFAVLVASAGGALLTDFAIFLTGDGFSRAAALRGLVINSFSAIANCSVAILTLILATRHPVALVLVGVVAVVLFLVLRANAGLAARYSRLEALYRVVGELTRADEADLTHSAQTVLREAKLLAGTRRAELYVLPGPSRSGLHGTVIDDTLHTEPIDAAGLPEHVRAALAGRAVNTTQCPSAAGPAGATAAMAAPLWHDGELRGALVVAEPLFATAQFDSEDLRMFETFTAHAVVTLHNARLTDDLRGEVAARDHEARHDALTGLPNWREFLTILARHRAGADAHATASAGGAVLLLALHDFREINEALGHRAGDQALIEVGRRLRQANSGPVARLGGDQFAVLLPESATTSETESRARELLSHIRRPIPVAGTSVVISATAGLARVTGNDNGEEALAQADNAMWQARSTADGVHTYVAEPEGDLTRRLRLAVDLAPALDAGELEVWYQPKADARTGVIHSVEALLRWKHPTYGFVPPPKIVMLAERTGQMRRLTDYVLAAALAQANAWAQGGRCLGVAVNISTHDLHDTTFPATVRRLLAQGTTPAEVLTLEITEGGVMRDSERCLAVLDELAALGVGRSVDDFGTGYSSLAYLDRLPVHEVKIDRSFVTRLEAHPQDTTVIKSTVDLGHALGLRVVAEGVESADVQQRLARLGCDVVQGYHIGRPAPAQDLADLLDIPADRRTLAEEQVADIHALARRSTVWTT
jgi:diguanylate cyclase (GGDEF)-like protein